MLLLSFVQYVLANEKNGSLGLRDQTINKSLISFAAIIYFLLEKICVIGDQKTSELVIFKSKLN